MLQFSGLNAVSQDFMDCMAEHNDLQMCQTLYPETSMMTTSAASTQAACDANPNTVWNDATGVCEPLGIDETPQSTIDSCNANPGTVWDSLTARCMIAAPTWTTPTTSNPTGKIATSTPASKPFPWKLIAGIGAVGLLGLLLYMRSSSKSPVVP